MKFLILLLLMNLSSCFSSKPQALILLAHFDDESMMSRTLYKLKDTHELHFIYLTKGEGGSDIRDKSIKGEALSKIRIQENDIVMKLVNAKQRYLLGLPDVPLRIPEDGYPNPKGRPTTNVDLFLNAGIWNLKEVISQVQNIIDSNNLNPQLVYTLSDDKGVTHAHHQSCEKIVKKLKFKNNLRMIYGILEDRYYDSNKFKKRDSTITIHKGNREKEDFVYQIHQAYKSQMLQDFTREELKNSVESLYQIHFRLK